MDIVDAICEQLSTEELTQEQADEISAVLEGRVRKADAALTEATEIAARVVDRRKCVDAINDADDTAVGMTIIWEQGRLGWMTFSHRDSDVRDADYLMLVELVRDEFTERAREHLFASAEPPGDCEA
jgi:hypothetical protein